MSVKSLDNPFDAESNLEHGSGCSCHSCAMPATHRDLPQSQEDIIDRAVESAVVRSLFNSDLERRSFIKLVGKATFMGALASVFPLDALKAAVKEKNGAIEKKNLKVGFVPITCATPIIMAHPMGFYKK